MARGNSYVISVVTIENGGKVTFIPSATITSTRIPIAQSAYQSGRSTTEQVFAIKMLAEKAITSSTYNIYLLLLDMSKAFDTVCRNKLLSDLQEVGAYSNQMRCT